MRIHQEGYKILLRLFLFLVLINCICIFLIKIPILLFFVLPISILSFVFAMFFFRYTEGPVMEDKDVIYAPADGKIVVIEKTMENEHYKDERIQVSIFMSAYNVHANWYPCDGVIKYMNHHPGKYYAAWNPKSSTNNERTTVVIENEKGFSLLTRQIAGIMARRIVSYGEQGHKVEQGKPLGFIKFGSRVDIFLPPETKIEVDLKQKVIGRKTIIARINK
ncbi:phosphatidylserine decarboxylase family protein [Bacteroidota bacterium]